MLIVPYISSLYNRLRIVRRGWASLRFEGRDKSMSDYEIIMLLLQVLAIYLYYRDKDLYRQIEINLINTKYIQKTYTY